MRYFKMIGPVAQWLEQSTHNALVLGSSPGRPTNYVPNNSILFPGLLVAFLVRRDDNPRLFVAQPNVLGGLKTH